ncbi:kinesin-like protein KIF15 [Zophobas morio]|uniref:kinesin-like protein KIF15 n=1 Tax=Zophobas morio TaxID=2755281 RepID=UPI0030828184
MSYLRAQEEIRKRQREREELRNARRLEFQRTQKQKLREQAKKDENFNKLMDVMFSEGKVNFEALTEFRAFYMKEVGSNRQLSNLRRTLINQNEDARAEYENKLEELEEGEAILEHKKKALNLLDEKFHTQKKSYEEQVGKLRQELIKLSDFSQEDEKLNSTIETINRNDEEIRYLSLSLEEVKEKELETVIEAANKQPHKEIKKIATLEEKVSELKAFLSKEQKFLEPLEKEVQELSNSESKKRTNILELDKKSAALKDEIKKVEVSVSEVSNKILMIRNENEKLYRSLERIKLKKKYGS